MNARMHRTRSASLALAAAVCCSLGFAGCQANKNEKPMARSVERSAVTPSAGAVAAAENARKPENIPDAKPPEILPDTHIAAGKLHESQGHFARAVEQYRMTVAIAPKNVEAHNRLGIVLDHLNRFSEADQAFQQAIKLAPQQAYLRNNLAFSYIMQTRWKDAEAALKEALSLKADFARARINLGMVLAQEDKFDDALVQFDQALSKGDAYYNLGLMYQSKHKTHEAASAFKTALENDPKLTAAQKRLDALPPDVVKSASTISVATASPVAGTTQIPPARQTARPSTQPASAPIVAPAAMVDHSAADSAQRAGSVAATMKPSDVVSKTLAVQPARSEPTPPAKIETTFHKKPEIENDPKLTPAIKTEQPAAAPQAKPEHHSKGFSRKGHNSSATDKQTVVSVTPKQTNVEPTARKSDALVVTKGVESHEVANSDMVGPPSIVKPAEKLEAKRELPKPPAAPTPAPAVQKTVEPMQTNDPDCIEEETVRDQAASFSPNPFELTEQQTDFSSMDVFSEMSLPNTDNQAVHADETVTLGYETPVSVILDAEFASIPKAAAAASALPADILDPCPTHEAVLPIPSSSL